MKIELEIQDAKADFFMEMLEHFSFVKSKKVSQDGLTEDERIEMEKEEQRESLRQAFKELKLIREGKLKSRPARELLDEL